MSRLEARISEFRLQLEREVAAGQNYDVVRGWLRTAGMLTVAAIGRPDNTLATDLRELWATLRERDDPLLVVFAPRPGGTSSFARRWWRPQLLLLAAAEDPDNHGRIASLLDCEPSDVMTAADRAGSRPRSEWSLYQWARFLGQAVLMLRPDPEAMPFGLEGQELRYLDRSCTLSPNQALLLRLLMDGYPEAVTHKRLEDHCINYPVEMKRNLMRKLQGCKEGRTWPFEIIGEQRSYRLQLVDEALNTTHR